MLFEESVMNPVWFSIDFLLAVLATWRVTHLLAEEDGPWDAIYKMRAALGESVLGSLMDCFKCLSLWVAVPAAFFVTRTPAMWFVVWLAISGAVCLLQRLAAERAGMQENPARPDNSEGDLNHVLWTETVSAEERATIGETRGAGEGADEQGGHAFNGTFGT